MRAAPVSGHPERAVPTLADFRAAAARIAPYIRRTPVLTASTDGRPVYLKLEHLQVAGVFKIRGALNALLAPGGAAPPVTPPSGGTHPVPPVPPGPPAGGTGPASRVPNNPRAPGTPYAPDASRGSCTPHAPEDPCTIQTAHDPHATQVLPRRVVTASGGNHGIGVATAAGWLGVAATVYVPGTVPDAKARRIAAAGADVVKTGRVYADAERAAREFAAREGLYYVHAYDDPAVVAGQGTAGLEIVADLPGCDVVAVPVGGGGLLAGVSGAIAPVRVVAVEPQGCPTLHAAVAAGAPVEVAADSIAASALGASRVGDLALAAYRANPVSLALVSDAAIIAARDRLWEEFRLAVEPAAATVFAAWLSGQVPGENPCLLLTGANAEWTVSDRI